MNGLLHRLAARAAGTAISVRSDARLPFGSVGPAFGETVEVESDAERAAPSVTATAELPGGSDTPLTAPGAPGAQPAPPAFSHRDTRPTPVVPPLDPSDASPSMRTPPRFVDAPADAAPQYRGEALAGAMPGRQDHTSASPGPPAGPMPIAAMAQPAPIPTESSSPADPPLLMPQAAPRQPPTPVRPVAELPDRLTASARAPAQTADEPHDVHVHIGRIEVTAVHEPAAPRRRPVAAPPPMSLDAYFTRRNRT
jgi:hypothetical protein